MLPAAAVEQMVPAKLEEWDKGMISFVLAQELKNAGFGQRTIGDAVYFGNAVYVVNEHLKVRTEDAQRLWFADKAREGSEFDPPKELVYLPTLTELIGACGLPTWRTTSRRHHPTSLTRCKTLTRSALK